MWERHNGRPGIKAYYLILCQFTYVLPKEAPVAAPASALDKKSPEASEVSAAEATQDLAPDENAQKTESIAIENDSSSILDQAAPPESLDAPQDLNHEEVVPADDGRRTEAIIIQQDRAGHPKSFCPPPRRRPIPGRLSNRPAPSPKQRRTALKKREFPGEGYIALPAEIK